MFECPFTILCLFVTFWLSLSSYSLALQIGYASTGFNHGAISLAVQKAKKDGILVHENITYAFRDSVCDTQISTNAALNLALVAKVDVIFGPVCTIACAPPGYIASYFNIPIFPEVCLDSAMDDKSDFSTMIRMTGSWRAHGMAFLRLFQNYGWTRAVFLSDNEQGPCYFGITSIRTQLTAGNVTSAEWVQMSSEPTMDDLDNYINRIINRGRIVLICHSQLSMIGSLLFRAQDRGLTDGDYVFFTFNSTAGYNVSQPWVDYDMTGSNMTYRSKAFYSLKQMTFSDETLNNETTEFLARVAESNMEEPWDTIRPNAIGLPTSQAAYLYDSIYLYLLLANKTMSQGYKPNNGSLILTESFNVRFEGLTGFVRINENGDRDRILLVWGMEPGASEFSPFLNINLALDGKMKSLRTNVVWGRNANPPNDTPTCGFMQELCLDPIESEDMVGLITGVVLASAAVIGFVLVLYIFRFKRMAARIEQMLWKINMDDIELIKGWSTTGALSETSGRTTVTNSEGALSGSHATASECLAGETLAVYRGQVVLLVPCKRPSVNLTRRDLIDLVNLKEIMHDNVQAFIGACVSPGSIYLVVQRCSRGSLQDIIVNDEVKLDWFFRLSFIADLINGMRYIHKSPFHSHGQLSSATCRVDNRWTLKITTMRLQPFRDLEEDPDSEEVDDDSKYGSLLWTAPELLRAGDSTAQSAVINVRSSIQGQTPLQLRQHQLQYGTQKGDVYSFSIIAQEIIYRAYPFFMQDNSLSKDIVKSVKAGGWNPYRPQLPPGDLKEMPILPALMRQCWTENPAYRPSFDDLARHLKLNRGRKLDIVDHVLQKLEKYANNLEGIVEQRTSELLDEKRKTDLLLNQMLPPSVAEQLKMGKTVPPEMFSSVTIYFSDIAGFTNLSSVSTPMQVVDLLNDLYGTFDDTISRHDVYKVETIGDAYMVVSGLPRTNGGKHIREICNMALDLLQEVSKFKVRHRPEVRLRLRIGIHKGPCAAGVVGHTMPRYCLFGDTVNVASRMESTGEASKIHMSSEACGALNAYPGYLTETRGQTYVKGKGHLTTYWLIGKQVEE